MTVEHLLIQRSGHARGVSGASWRSIGSSWIDEFFKLPVPHALDHDPHRAEQALILVETAHSKLVKPNDKAWIRVHGRGYNYWRGTVRTVSGVEAKEVPPQLSNRSAKGGAAVAAAAVNALLYGDPLAVDEPRREQP